MMMIYGMFVFELRTLPHQQLQHNKTWRHVKNERINRSASWQYIGAGDDQITLSGVLYPEITGGEVSLSLLTTQAYTGRPWPLIDGVGQIYGMYVITAVRTTRSELDRHGKAKKIEFTVSLERCDEDLRESMASSPVSDMLSGMKGKLSSVWNNRAVIILACPFKNFITYAFKFCGECLGCQCGDALDFVTGELRQCEQFFKAMAHDGGFECRRCKAVVNPFNTFQARTQSTANEIIGHVCAVVFYTFTAGTLLFPVQSCQITDQHTGKKRGQGAKFGYRLRYRRWRIFASVSCQLIQPYLPLFVPVKV